MAEMNTGDGGGGKGKHSKKRAKKSSTKVDMTPMVDLAFLLLTFFMLTATFNKPKTLEITFPKDLKEEEKDKKMKVDDALATTFLVGDKTDEVYYYKGVFKPDTTKLEKLDMGKTGIRKFLLGRNEGIDKGIKDLEKQYKEDKIADTTFYRLRKELKGGAQAPFVIVKTCKLSKYKSIIDIIDELNISNIGKYAVVDMSDPEIYELYKIIRPELVGGGAPAAQTN